MRTFPPRAYRDAAALVAAEFQEDMDSFETILDEAGPALARPGVKMLLGALGRAVIA
ncbi:MAG: hypothetical protein WB383_06030 [Acidimicrobiales bacterium]